jgi:hypothetical protein
MISAPSRVRTRRLLLIGLMLSLMAHLFGGSVFGLLSRAINRIVPLASRQAPPAVKSDIIRLERPAPTAAPVAIAKPHPNPPPPPAPRVAPRVVPAPAPESHEIVHITVNAPRQTAPSRHQGVAEVPDTVPPAAPPEPQRQYYSQDQVEQMNGDFAKAIAESHQTLADANAAMATTPVVTTRHFAMHFNGIHEGLNPGDGVITALKEQRIGNQMYYWTHYEYMYGDGRVEEDDIPWPFHYPINDDPFARHDRRIPLQAPPDGYKPDRPLKPILMQFFGGPQVD